MSAGIATTKGTLKDVVDATVRALFTRANEDQAQELYYSTLGLTDYEPDVPEEVLNDLSAPTKAILGGEGQEYGVVTKVRGYSVTLKMRKYTFKLSFTEEDQHWLAKSASSKRLTEVRDYVADAVLALNQRINEDACKVFYLGFGTTFLTVGNSEALYTNSHYIKVDGSTQGNMFPSGDTQRPIGSTAIIDAISIMNRFKGHNGNQLLKCRSIKVIVAHENTAEANKIIYSDYGPNTNNLGLQPASQSALAKRGVSIEVTTAPDIPYAYRKYWFLVETNRAAKRAFIAWAWKPRMNEDTEYHNGTMHMFGSTFFGPVVLGWQWTFGSTGADTAI